jgi:hypothetical protein
VLKLLGIRRTPHDGMSFVFVVNSHALTSIAALGLDVSALNRLAQRCQQSNKASAVGSP